MVHQTGLGSLDPGCAGWYYPHWAANVQRKWFFIALPFWLKISSRRFRFPPALTIEKSDSGVMGPPTPRGSASLMNWHSNSKFASTSPRDIQCQTVASSCGQVLAEILISPLAIPSSKGGTSLEGFVMCLYTDCCLESDNMEIASFAAIFPLSLWLPLARSGSSDSHLLSQASSLWVKSLKVKESLRGSRLLFHTSATTWRMDDLCRLQVSAIMPWK